MKKYDETNRYLITTPPYCNHSAGVRVLHELHKHIIRAGYDAVIITPPYDYISQKGDIAVYPEIIKGNPLQAEKVVRYILNVPDDSKFSENEIRIAYIQDLAQYANYNILTVPSVETFFLNRNLERTIELCYIGKGYNIHQSCLRAGKSKKYDKLLQITSHYPKTRLELAEILNNCRTLYSFDDFSAILTEARKCGCEVKIINENGETRDHNCIYDESIKDFPDQLQNFLRITNA